MMTREDIIRIGLPLKLTTIQAKRIFNAEKACKNTENAWAKKYWYTVFEELCKIYGAEDYYRSTIH